MGKRFIVAFMSVLFVSSGYAYGGVDCSTDCARKASFRYPCPTVRNPGRKCEGREPTTYLACETTKKTSCELWQGALRAVAPRLKDMLSGTFNAGSWAAATEGGDEDMKEYMIKCESAGVAACAALGAAYGGPWGAGLSGAIGVFVAYEVCNQSTRW